jgi:hypothetical protein
MTPAEYSRFVRLMDTAGLGAPNGRLYHVCFGSGDGLQVFEVWDSQASFIAFGDSATPILKEAGIELGEPMIEAVHGAVAGQHTARSGVGAAA